MLYFSDNLGHYWKPTIASCAGYSLKTNLIFTIVFIQPNKTINAELSIRHYLINLIKHEKIITW